MTKFMRAFPVDCKEPRRPPWNGLSSTRSDSQSLVICRGNSRVHNLVILPSTFYQAFARLISQWFIPRCPVCNSSLADLGDASEQEDHVKNCLDGGSGTTPQAAKYLVYKLPAESALIGVECVICLEEFAKGNLVPRLSRRVADFVHYRLSCSPPQLLMQLP